MKRFLFTMLLCVTGPLFSLAQVMTNNNVAITITSGATITVNGAIQNNVGTTISNSGTIRLNGDFVNNSLSNLFGASSGSVNMFGGLQNISGSSVTRFNNLTLSGTGNKILQRDIETGATGTGTLNLNDRVLDLNSYSLYVINPLPSAITRTTGFIQSETDPIAGYGTVFWLAGNISAPKSYTIPLGNAASGDYLPVTLDFTSNGIGASGNIQVSMYPTNTAAIPNNRPLPTGLPVLTNFAGVENAANTIDRFWLVDLNDYTTLPSSNITFTYRDSEWSTGSNTIIESSLVPQRHDFSTWSLPLAGVINTTANTMVVNGVNSYSMIWTLAGNTSPLPVELIEFTADPVNNSEVLCKWITASEINNDYFVVERSRDGSGFEYVGTVDGAGNSVGTLSYNFTDTSPFKGISYYRLKQVDFNGAYSYSQIAAVRITGIDQQVSIYPNPSSGDVYLVTDNLESVTIPVSLFDASGRLVYQKEIYGNKVEQFDFSSLAKGIYSLKVTLPDEQSVFRLVLQ